MSEPALVVVIVDDDRFVRHFVHLVLEAERMSVFEASTGKAGVAAVAARRPDLIVADITLPDLGGPTLIRALRTASLAPLIVLSARSAEADKVAALDAGADDYLTKPFGSTELLARLRALLRRHSGDGQVRIERARFGNLTIDFGERKVLRGGTRVHLSPIEYRLLAALAHHPDHLMTHDELLRQVWGPAHLADQHALRVYVGHLRRKLERDPRRPEIIVTETGIGYRFVGTQ